MASRTIQCVLTSIFSFSDRIPVPNGKSCDLGLPGATCKECTKYYDPTSGFRNTDEGKCVWVPDMTKCYAKLVATGGAPNYNDWTVDFNCHEKSNTFVLKT